MWTTSPTIQASSLDCYTHELGLSHFFEWHNDEHLFTPEEIFFERVMAMHAFRQDTLNTAHQARFPNGPPQVAIPPAQVNINPLESLVAAIDNPRLTEPRQPPANR